MTAAGHEPDLARHVQRALDRASHALAERQQHDGAWRDAADTELHHGHALTGHVLRALRSVPQPATIGDVIARGMDFLEGTLGSGEPFGADAGDLPYPITAAAASLSVLATSRRPGRRALIARLVPYLCAGQYAQDAGYSPSDDEYGGFGYRPARHRDDGRPRVPELDHPHLSASVFVIEALARSTDPRSAHPQSAHPQPTHPQSAHPQSTQALARAQRFVHRCQNYAEGARGPNDGGFVFSPAVPELNKAGPAPGSATGFRSYGTMTANGIRMLAWLGEDPSGPRLRAAANWLVEHFAPDRVAGDFDDDRLGARDAVFYYYVWTATSALAFLSTTGFAARTAELRWAHRIATQLLERQGADGLWRSTAGARKETVDLIASMHAVQALAACVPQLR